MEFKDISKIDSRLNDYEKELVIFFAKCYKDRNEIVSYNEFPRYDELKNIINSCRERLTKYGLIEGYASTDIRVLPTVLDMVEYWDNPPLPDYRDKVTKWFWSRPSSIVVLIVFVVLPLLVTWVGMLKTLLEWFGIKK